MGSHMEIAKKNQFWGFAAGKKKTSRCLSIFFQVISQGLPDLNPESLFVGGLWTSKYIPPPTPGELGRTHPSPPGSKTKKNPVQVTGSFFPTT